MENNYFDDSQENSSYVRDKFKLFERKEILQRIPHLMLVLIPSFISGIMLTKNSPVKGDGELE
jgi:hypothetical protein